MKILRRLHLCYVISAVAVIGNTKPMSAAATSKPSAWSNTFTATFDTTKVTVDNMPLEIRNVPIHQNDALGTPGPVTQVRYTQSCSFMLDACRTWESERYWFGVGVGWILFPFAPDMEERNYTTAVGTDQRGNGAALTFVRITRRGIFAGSSDGFLDLFTNLTPSATAGIHLTHDWAIGANVNYQRLIACNGWDRYDKYEVNKRYSLLTLMPISIYLRRSGFSIGYTTAISTESRLGKEAAAKFQGGFFIGYGGKF
jgi:hypothetical protein